MQWQSQYRSRHINEDQDPSFMNSTTHMLNITLSLKGTLTVKNKKKNFLLTNYNIKRYFF